ncbi:hypothetical protein [Halpernia frigidisoli]|uniref:Uncharacterized protein n=1 Tax=Halpernia frigidisoli TaxID=1125876 RepID=A0A1I3D237_9FLAO|nr:hypothetical protein [Halpernia frigidisoli]SFH80561.1 hypothetical protein SAMN05443292_0204 [Halpernia frigidisoli]
MFRVLEKPKESKLKISKILNFTIISLTIFLIVFFLATIFFWYVDFHKEIVFKIAGVLLGFFIVVKILQHNFFQQKKGVFMGTLIFKENEIEVLDNIYSLENIATVRIKGNDIKGEFRGLKSLGTNNELFINLQNEEKLVYFFEQTEENSIKNLSVLKSYAEKGKLAESNYESIIANSNYY